jgi:hypothetical protein
LKNWEYGLKKWNRDTDWNRDLEYGCMGVEYGLKKWEYGLKEVE